MRYDLETTSEALWKQMERLCDLGLVRNIGLSNFTSSQIVQIFEIATIKPAVLQIEVHPFFNQQKLVEFCAGKGIIVTAYSPLGSGSVLDGYTVPTHPALVAIGEKYGKTAAQVALRFQIQRGISVIPKSVKAARIHQNLAVCDFVLSDADMSSLMALDANLRTGWGGPLVLRDGGEKRPRDEIHPLYPFKMGADGKNDAAAF
jgi:alcohol dehydrogenase (NADP+)